MEESIGLHHDWCARYGNLACDCPTGELLDRINLLESSLEEAQLARIAAENPGIDIDEVRESRKLLRRQPE